MGSDFSPGNTVKLKIQGFYAKMLWSNYAYATSPSFSPYFMTFASL